jgi:hypothetical protein
MPVYDWDDLNSDAPRPMKAVDAISGQDLGALTWCNTETGEYRRLSKNERGEFFVDPATDEPAIECGVSPGGIRLVPLVPA